MHFFAFFCPFHFEPFFALVSTALSELFSLLMSVTQPEAGAQAHTNDEEEENEPNLLENDSDDDEPKAKKSKTSLNYRAKTTPASRARQYPPGTFEPRGETMWCMACQKPVDYKRKSVADAHLKTPAHKAKAKCKKKEKQPVQTTQPVGAENPVAILTPGSSGNTMQSSLKDMLKARLCRLLASPVTPLESFSAGGDPTQSMAGRYTTCLCSFSPWAAQKSKFSKLIFLIL